jgi:hypothetical protein
MYYVQDAHSFWDWIYFVLLIVVSKKKLPIPLLKFNEIMRQKARTQSGQIPNSKPQKPFKNKAKCFFKFHPLFSHIIDEIFWTVPKIFSANRKKDQLTKRSISNLLLERICPSKFNLMVKWKVNNMLWFGANFHFISGIPDFLKF